MLIGAKISMQLTSLGYEVTGLMARGEDALKHVAEYKPDIVLLDIQLKGGMDGIETAKQIGALGNIAFIFLTANSDEATFNRAKITKPAAFISKPFKQLDLQRAIELAISRMDSSTKIPLTEEINASESSHFLEDRMFVRHKDRMVRIMYQDVLCIEAERNYSRIITKKGEYLLSITLKSVEDRLPVQFFVRVHRSYLINITMIEEVADSYVLVCQKNIPMSNAMKENLLKRINML